MCYKRLKREHPQAASLTRLRLVTALVAAERPLSFPDLLTAVGADHLPPHPVDCRWSANPFSAGVVVMDCLHELMLDDFVKETVTNNGMVYQAKRKETMQ